MNIDCKSDTIVFNTVTRNFVPYRVNSKTGEIIITSKDDRDTDLNCIVTTWDNIYRKNLEIKSRGVKW